MYAMSSDSGKKKRLRMKCPKLWPFAISNPSWPESERDPDAGKHNPDNEFRRKPLGFD
jgi:hypothetical protein